MKDELIEELPVIDTAETDNDLEPRRYELGYLLTPIIAAETVSGTVETLIRGTITAAGGQIIGGEEPKLIPLAYPIRKTVENKNLRFQEAYFASLRFSAPPVKIIELDKVFRFSPTVLRFLIIESPKPVAESRHRPKDNVGRPPAEETKDKEKELEPPEAAMSQADLDREIEGLLI